MSQAIIAPSILASDLSNLTEECRRMQSGGADWIHYDVMDGNFVPNLTLGAPVLTCLTKNLPELYTDCHMMVAQPAQWVPDVAKAGARSYTFHYEATDSHAEVISLIKEHGMKAGLAISPETPSTVITDDLGNSVDLLLVMTVRPGFGGQKFMGECLSKVTELRTRFPNKNIQVDGGVGAGNACQCAQAGSNVLVAGSAIFGSEDPKATMTEMRSSVDEEMAKWK